MSPQARASGPLVWAAVVAATCALLLVFQAALWLVVPFLVALVLYYVLRPALTPLIYAGLSREAAAALVSGVFLALAVGAGALAWPWVAAHAASWQESLARYVDGGTAWLQATLALLEDRSALARGARVSESVNGWIVAATGDFAQRHGAQLILTLATWLPSVLLAPFLSFFMLRDGRSFQRFVAAAVPNAYFERALYLFHQVDRTAHAYFQGLLRLTVLDALTLAAGLWLLGLSAPLTLGFVTAVLAWIPYVGSIIGCLIVVLVAATDFPAEPGIAYGAIALFVLVRLLDDFFFMPATIGRSLRIHPLLSVLMIFVGGAIAGVAGLMLVLPLLGVVAVVGQTLGQLVTDPRLRARHAHARRLRARHASRDLAA